MMSFTPRRSRLARWAARGLAGTWVALAAAWAFGPGLAPYDPWGTAEPPGRPFSIAVPPSGADWSVFAGDAWRRELILHPADRTGWEAIHGVWLGSTRGTVYEPGFSQSVWRPGPGLIVRTGAVPAAWRAPYDQERPFADQTGEVRTSRLWAVDFLWLGGALGVWTIGWFVWRRWVAGSSGDDAGEESGAHTDADAFTNTEG